MGQHRTLPGETIKVVMTGAASDPEHYSRHLMTGQVRKMIENRFKDPD